MIGAATAVFDSEKLLEEEEGTSRKTDRKKKKTRSICFLVKACKGNVYSARLGSPVKLTISRRLIFDHTLKHEPHFV